MPTNIFDMSDTWNSGTTVFNAIKMNVTTTAQAAGSKILDLLRNNVSEFSVWPAGGVLIGLAAGGAMGAGTINASNYYRNGVLVDTSVFVKKAGDTMTGDLTIDKSQPAVQFKFASNTAALFTSVAPSGQFRWQFIIADGSPEIGSNLGSNFRIDRYGDAGDYLGTPITIDRQSGNVIIRNAVLVGTPGVQFQFTPPAPATLGSITSTGQPRWVIALGEGTPEGGGNTGTNFRIDRYANDGTFLGSPFTIRRSDGLVTIPNLSGRIPEAPTDGQLYSRRGSDASWQVSPSGGGGGGAPIDADYIVGVANPGLTAERVLTGTATIAWDLSTPGQVKANATVGGGNVSNSGTPTTGQIARWVDATHIEGISVAGAGVQPLDATLTALAGLATGANQVPFFTGTDAASQFTATSFSRGLMANVDASNWLTGLGAQPLDGDLTSLAGANTTNAIYYRSAADTWSAVTIGANLTFTGGTLAATGGGGGGNVSNVGTPTNGQWAQWTGATTIQGVATASMPFVQKAGDTMTGSLGISAVSPNLTLTGSASNTNIIMDAPITASNIIVARKATASRWNVILGSSDAETGLNVGSNFLIERFTDGGTVLNSGQTLKILRESGNILVGHSSNAGAAQARMQVHGQDCLSLLNWAASTASPILAFHHSRSAVVGTITALADGDSLGLITFLGAGTSGFGIGAQIQALVMGTPSGNVIPAGYGFDTRTVTSGMQRRLTVTSAGSIVVGPMPFALANGILEINNESALGLGGAFWNKWSNDGAGFELYLRKSRGLTSNIFTAVQAGDNIGSIFFLGASASGFVPSATITVDATGAPTTAVPSTMRFSAATASATITCMLLDPVNGQNILGTTAANNASAGFVGEVVANNASTSPIGGTPANITSISLTAGDWDVMGTSDVTNGAGAAILATISLSSVSASVDPTIGRISRRHVAAAQEDTPFLSSRFSLSATTTIYLVASAPTTGLTCIGQIWARRRR